MDTVKALCDLRHVGIHLYVNIGKDPCVELIISKQEQYPTLISRKFPPTHKLALDIDS